jgi:hypothetical protein
MKIIYTWIRSKLIKHHFVKYLGITIDQYLKWNINIENLIIRMRQLTYFFIIAKKILNKNIIRITYFAMAQSIIQYGLINTVDIIPVWKIIY